VTGKRRELSGDKSRAEAIIVHGFDDFLGMMSVLLTGGTLIMAFAFSVISGGPSAAEWERTDKDLANFTHVGDKLPSIKFFEYGYAGGLMNMGVVFGSLMGYACLLKWKIAVIENHRLFAPMMELAVVLVYVLMALWLLGTVLFMFSLYFVTAAKFPIYDRPWWTPPRRKSSLEYDVICLHSGWYEWIFDSTRACGAGDDSRDWSRYSLLWSVSL